MKKIVFTDLDGTLLDHDTYSYDKAKEALNNLNKNKIPLVFCTSKTRSEIIYWREKIGNSHPFISENGGGVFIPKDYFSFDFNYDYKKENYLVIELGVKYEKLLNVINEIKKDFPVVSFDDMSVEELVDETDMSIDQARLAKSRDFDIPFKILSKSNKKEIIDKIENMGFNIVSGGRFFHIMGDNDKGKAVIILSKLFKKKYDSIKTIGIGDSENDFPMLDNVDNPYLVMKKNSKYVSSKYTFSGGVGPDGFRKVVEIELRK